MTKPSFTEQELQEQIDAGFVKKTKHPSADLYILNYTPACQWDGAWNEVTSQCRGLIVDGDFNVVARPFPKFHNWSQHEQEGLSIPEGPIEVTEKMDGSLGILYWIGDKPFIATRGSFMSDQAIEATRMFHEMYDRNLNMRDAVQFLATYPATLLFEIIYPANRIVVDYGTQRRLTLIAVIDNVTGEDMRLPQWYPDRVRIYPYADIESVLLAEQLPGTTSEGFVARFENGLRLKFKFEDYKRLHRLLTGVNARHIWDHLRQHGDITSLIEDVPDEFYEWVKKIEHTLMARYIEIESGCKIDFAVCPEGERKEIAEYFKTCEYPGILFAMLDGKVYSDAIWKIIKPSGTETPFKEDIDA